MAPKNRTAGPGYIEPDRRVTIAIAARFLDVTTAEVHRRIKGGKYRTLRVDNHVYVDVDEILEGHNAGIAGKAFAAFEAGKTPIQFVLETSASPRAVQALWNVWKTFDNDERVKKMKAKNAVVEKMIEGPCATCGRDERRRRADHAYFLSTPTDPAAPCPGCHALRAL